MYLEIFDHIVKHIFRKKQYKKQQIVFPENK